MQTTICNGAPDAEQGDGTNRYGKGEADDDSLEERAEFHG